MNWFIKFLQKYSDEPYFTGAILPTEEEVKNLDQFTDIVASATEVVWKPLATANLPTWTQYDQFLTYSCVANSIGLMKSVMYYQRRGIEWKFSPLWIYGQRVNKPTAGMIGVDAFSIDGKVGQIPYDLLPSPASEEGTVNPKSFPEFYDIAKIFRGDDVPIIVPVKDIDTLVSIQQVTNKPIMVWFEFEWQEWVKNQPTIEYNNPRLRHSVVFIPKKKETDMSYGLWNGEKAIVVQDSTGLPSTINGKRIITESFFKSRNIFVAYMMRFKFEVSLIPITWDGSIISLQKCLQSKGFFPTNVSFVENFGPTTKGALRKFQQFAGIPVTGELDAITKASLHQYY